jgi:hypothetical protein
MKPPYVCTELTTNGRIVSSNSKPPGVTLPVGFLLCGSGEILVSGKAENASLYPHGSSSLSRTPHQAKISPQTPAQVLDLTLINLFYSLTKGSNFPIRIQKSKIKNVLRALDFLRNFEIFDFRFQTKNPPLSRFNLVTEGSNFQIRTSIRNANISYWGPLSRRAREATSIRSANVSRWAPLSRRAWEANLKSAFRNRLGALDYRRLSEIIGFEFLSFSGSGAAENLFYSLSSRSKWMRHFIPKIVMNLTSTRFVQNLQFHTKLHSAIYSLNIWKLATYQQKLTYPPPPSLYKRAGRSNYVATRR